MQVTFDTYRGAGTYSIRWERGGKRRTVRRWANNIDELRGVVAAFENQKCVILSVRFRGA
jgi:hypothetical protein